MLKLENYGLKIKDKVLFQNVNVLFSEHTISHILGNNGCGKSSFGKSCVGMLSYTGSIVGNEKIILIEVEVIFQVNFPLETSATY